MVFRTLYKRPVERAFALDFDPIGEPSFTIQSQTEDTDINIIMDKFVRGMDLPLREMPLPLEGDFSEVDDYLSSRIAMRKVDETFNRLPAKIRSKFDNDAGLFFEFCTNRDNLKELKELGFDVSAYMPDEAPEMAPVPSTVVT